MSSSGSFLTREESPFVRLYPKQQAHQDIYVLKAAAELKRLRSTFLNFTNNFNHCSFLFG